MPQLPVRCTHPVIHPSPTVEPSTTMMSPAMKEIVLLSHLPFAHSSARVGDFCTSELKPMASVKAQILQHQSKMQECSGGQKWECCYTSGDKVQALIVLNTCIQAWRGMQQIHTGISFNWYSLHIVGGQQAILASALYTPHHPPLTNSRTLHKNDFTCNESVLSDIIYIYSYCLCTILSCMHYWFVLSLKVTVFITTVSFVTSFLSDHVYIEPEHVSCILCKRFIST